MKTYGWLVFVSIFVLASALVIYFKLKSRKEAIRQKQKILGMGFREIDPPDPAFVANLIRLSQMTPGQLNVSNVFYRRDLECELYLFDMWDTTGEDDVHNGGVAILSDQLHLPRFTLIPRIPSEGGLSDLANSLLDKIPIPGIKNIPIENDPQFARNYRLLGKDEDDVRHFFDETKLRILDDTSYWMIEAEGNMFIFDKQKLDPAHKKINNPVEERIRDAMTAFQILR